MATGTLELLGEAGDADWDQAAQVLVLDSKLDGPYAEPLAEEPDPWSPEPLRLIDLGITGATRIEAQALRSRRQISAPSMGYLALQRSMPTFNRDLN